MKIEVLDSRRKRVFDLLKNFERIDEFELGGGTALALQIGHRVSVDFDFFSKETLSESFRNNVIKRFSENTIEIKQSTKDELTFLIDGVKITFLYYPFPRILPCVDLEGVKVLDILEIAATKAYTIGKRSEYKDYIDLYFVLNRKDISLEDIINLCKKKYLKKFNSRLFLEQLVFMEDVEESEIKFMNSFVSKKQLAAFFEDLVSKFKISS